MPRGVGLCGDDGHFAAHQRVDQCGLPDVRAPDDGNVAGVELGGAHGRSCISAGSNSKSFAAANCSARRRLPASPTAIRPKGSTSQLTTKVCACGSPETEVKV